jgi:hypothetical protein
LDSNQPLPVNSRGYSPRIRRWNNMVCVVGFEPTASSFQTRPSTRLTLHTDKIGAVDGNRTRLNLIDNQVPYPEDYNGINLVPLAGIEPTHPAYKTGPLPLRIKGQNWLRRKYSKLLGRAYETDRSPESPQLKTWRTPRDSNPH